MYVKNLSSSYDFREEIAAFQTDGPIDRHFIYQAVGIAQEALRKQSVKQKGAVYGLELHLPDQVLLMTGEDLYRVQSEDDAVQLDLRMLQGALPDRSCLQVMVVQVDPEQDYHGFLESLLKGVKHGGEPVERFLI